MQFALYLQDSDLKFPDLHLYVILYALGLSMSNLRKETEQMPSIANVNFSFNYLICLNSVIFIELVFI